MTDKIALFFPMVPQPPSPAIVWNSGALQRGLEPQSPYLAVGFGQHTFDLEGAEAATRFFSRVIHWPGGSNSGVTIGRGYDMGLRTSPQIESDLRAAGVSGDDATLFAQGAGLRGRAAKAFVDRFRTTSPLLSLSAQNALFLQTARELITDIKRILAKPDVVERYGSIAWERLPVNIQELLFDLRYRGDFTPATRAVVMPAIKNGDGESLQKIFDDKGYWSRHGVPPGRTDMRRLMVGQC